MKEFLKEKVKEAVEELYGLADVVEKASFEKPKKKEYGDMATNVSFLLAKELRKNPAEISKSIAEKLSKLEEFEKVEPIGGFLNFRFSGKFYSKLLEEIVETDYYVSNVGNGQKVLLEYVSANPTGPLHVGHGRGAVVGDVLYRVMKLTNFNVEREFYINDAGRQVKLLGLSIYLRAKELAGEKVELPEDAYRGEYIVELAKDLVKEKPEILKMDEEEGTKIAQEFGVKKLLEKIKSDLKAIGVEFDNWFSEKSLYETGKVEKAIEILKEKGLTYEKDGALWFKAKDLGDDKDRVLRKSNREYTYFASDIAYHLSKIERGYERAINIWGADHHGYIKRVKCAIESFGKNPDWLDVLLVQIVKVLKDGKEVKMSKREGKFVELSWLVEEVGKDAVRFFFLLKRHDTPLDFDVNLALEKSSENPVYYVQYAHARICSVLDKGKSVNIYPSKEHLHLLTLEEEKELINFCYLLKYELQEIALKLEPHRLSYYLIELASRFHKYYNANRIVDEENVPLSSARLYLCEGVKKALYVGLQTLNVNAPRRM